MKNGSKRPQSLIAGLNWISRFDTTPGGKVEKRVPQIAKGWPTGWSSFLASPHYGERMAGGWLECWSFAGHHGLHIDPSEDYAALAWVGHRRL